MSVPDLLGDGDESFSVIERLADTIRIDHDERIGVEDRERLVRDLYEGPRKCQCCINWVNELPLHIEPKTVPAEESPYPLIVRRRVLPTKGKSVQVTIDSIEICNAEVRGVLFNVFEGYQGIIPAVKFLVFKAPFHPFFWRWERFEKAIEEEQNEVVKATLLQLRSIVKPELAEAFAVTQELVPHGLITAVHLWTIFPPGEIVYERRLERNGSCGQYYSVGSTLVPWDSSTVCQLGLYCVDWDGARFGLSETTRMLHNFPGARQITSLDIVPAKYVKDGDKIRAKCIERGRKFQSYAGLKYVAYDGPGNRAESNQLDGSTATKQAKHVERRIMLDAEGYLGGRRARLHAMAHDFPLGYRMVTALISQAPVGLAPPGGHRPLVTDNNGVAFHNPVFGNPAPPLPHQPFTLAPSPTNDILYPPLLPATDGDTLDFQTTGMAINPDAPNITTANDAKSRAELTEVQLQLCKSHLGGYCLREKTWINCEVDRIKEIEWNTNPFDSLVLPDGYKDLILSFVESQIKDGDSFDDVINGKGGGLVILLAGSPGVGKTMTAESVAEKIRVPLVKFDLAQMSNPFSQSSEDSHASSSRRGLRRGHKDELTKVFEQAARWGAVLLIDECDTYLEKRGDNNEKRNFIVSQFLRELEYYPSLLFLTTNREKSLDPAIYSRIHLTINYPSLDFASRLSIWKTFLGRERAAVTDEEMAKLADVNINGRRIKNITKTARIIAKRGDKAIGFADIKNAMRITEGLSV